MENLKYIAYGYPCKSGNSEDDTRNYTVRDEHNRQIASINYHVVGCDQYGQLFATAPEMLSLLRGIISHNNALKDDAKISPALIDHINRVINKADINAKYSNPQPAGKEGR